MSERYIVAEEQYMTNPPKHAGWAILDTQTRRPVEHDSNKGKLEKLAQELNFFDD